jgi:hypothetical protein
VNPYPDQSDPELDDPGLSALYRQGATQTPPAELDRRILDQAQTALGPRSGKAITRARGQEPRRWRWLRCWNWLPRWPLKGDGRGNWRRLAIPLSSAAALLLTVGLGLRLLEEHSALQGITGMAPSAPADDQSTQSPPSQPEREVAAKQAAEATAIGLSAAAPLSPVLPPALAPANQAQGDERRSAMPMADRAGDLHPKSRIADEMPQADPERWLEAIRQRWSSGQETEALRQLATFRQVHPQYPLPEDLAPLLEAE